MVCLDMDHPEIVDFINWKVREEKKAQALIAVGLTRATSTATPTTRVSGQNSQQLDPRHRRVHARGARRRRVADARAHHR